MVYLPISPTITTGNVSLWMLELFDANYHGLKEYLCPVEEELKNDAGFSPPSLQSLDEEGVGHALTSLSG